MQNKNLSPVPENMVHYKGPIIPLVIIYSNQFGISQQTCEGSW